MEDRKKKLILFGPGGCLTREAISRYIDLKLSERELKKVKRHASSCDLCNDALKGAAFFRSGNNYTRRIYTLQNSPWRKTFETPKSSKKLFVGLSSIAASIALLMGIMYVFHFKTLWSESKEISQLPHVNYIIEESEADSLDIIAYMPTSKHKEIPRLKRVKLDSSIDVDKNNMDVLTDELIAELELDIFTDEENIEEIAFSFSPDETGGENKESNSKQLDMPKNKESVSNNEDDNSGFFKIRSNRKKNEEHKEYYVAEILPVFRGGGMEDFNRFIEDSLKVTLNDTVMKQSIIVAFCINTDGKVTNVKLVSGTSSKELNTRVLEMVENSGGWVPARLKGEPVAVEQQLEIVLGNE